MTHILTIFIKFFSSFGRLQKLIIIETQGEIAILFCIREKQKSEVFLEVIEEKNTQ
jgi:hypothetical protein